MERKKSIYRMHHEKLEEIFSLYSKEIYSYAFTLLRDKKKAEGVLLNVFADFFRTFSEQKRLSESRFELMQHVWISIHRKRHKTDFDKKMPLRSVIALQQIGLSNDEIKFVMRLRSSKFNHLLEKIREELEYREPTLNDKYKIMHYSISISQVWKLLLDKKRKSRITLFTVSFCVLVTIALLVSYSYSKAHVPAEKTHISIENPLHLVPKGTIVHTVKWMGTATLENWQNTKTGQTKTIYRDKELEEDTYWVNNYQYYFSFKNGILQKAKQSKTIEKPSELLSQQDPTNLTKIGEENYHGISVTKYIEDNLEIYIDKQYQLVLLTKANKTDSKGILPIYYGYEYLQSSGYGFFDPPNNTNK